MLGSVLHVELVDGNVYDLTLTLSVMVAFEEHHKRGFLKQAQTDPRFGDIAWLCWTAIQQQTSDTVKPFRQWLEGVADVALQPKSVDPKA